MKAQSTAKEHANRLAQYERHLLNGGHPSSSLSARSLAAKPSARIVPRSGRSR